jgi:glyoxylase-like metal-dependent hydrolase (beta-lactamase superfamily II)
MTDTAEAATTPLAGSRRYQIGEIALTVVADGGRVIPVPEGLVKNAPIEAVAAALESAGYTKGTMPFFFNPVVIDTGGRQILVDTGNGEAAFQSSKGSVGQLQANLMASGIDATRIEAVFITHFHGDHINGLLDPNGKPAFPGAEILVPQAEWAYWTDDGNASRASDALKPNFANVKRVFDALGRKVTQIKAGEVLATGLSTMATPGHTPGHTSLVINSGGKGLVIQGDVTNLPALFARNPGWHGRFDMDPATAEATRRSLYDRAVAEGLLICGYHYPFPAVGRIARDGAGYRVDLAD